MCKQIYIENGVVIGCDFDQDYNDPYYHLAMDYLEGRIKPNYPVPCTKQQRQWQWFCNRMVNSQFID